MTIRLDTDRQANATGVVAAQRHAPWEDALGIVCGIVITALGLSLCTTAGLVSASTAGLAVLLHYVSPLSVGSAFFLVNVPFYVFA